MPPTEKLKDETGKAFLAILKQLQKLSVEEQTRLVRTLITYYGFQVKGDE